MKKFAIASVLAFTATIFAAHAQSQVIVIANPSIKSADVSKNDLRDVFTGAATTLKDGSKVVPILLKGGIANEEFLKAYVGKSDSAYRAGWRSLVFSGQASMPKSLEGDAAVAEFVAHTPGTIGYIDKSTAHEGVKVLSVK